MVKFNANGIKRHWPELILGFIIGVLIVLLTHSPTDVEIDARQYCSMVHKGTWPDFKRVYKQQCHRDGSVNWAYVYGGN
jgi:hypothetical protein